MLRANAGISVMTRHAWRALGVIDEVRLSVAERYKILEMFEVYEYKVTRYDPETCEGGLFVQYINTFLN